MKKQILQITLTGFLFIFLTPNTSFSQNNTRKFKFIKVSKDVKKETRKYESDGWRVFPGKPPISQQLNNAFTKQSEVEQDGFPKWITSSGSSVAQTQAAAQMQATELAKNNLVGLLETQMKSVVEIDLSNNQLSSQEAVTINKTIQVATNKVSKKLGMVQPMLQIYRPVGSNNTEVQILIGYSYEMARKQVLEEMKQELQLETDDVRKRYQKFLNPETYKQGEIKNESEK
jgi:hypothetical protein